MIDMLVENYIGVAAQYQLELQIPPSFKVQPLKTPRTFFFLNKSISYLLLSPAWSHPNHLSIP